MKNILKEKSMDFSLEIIDLSDALKQIRMYEIASQLVRSGTSIGANIYESEFAESKNDLIHKLKISEKEAAETMYWIKLCNRSKKISINENTINSLIEIQKILSASIKNT